MVVVHSVDWLVDLEDDLGYFLLLKHVDHHQYLLPWNRSEHLLGELLDPVGLELVDAVFPVLLKEFEI